jgi:hypothetical protein
LITNALHWIDFVLVILSSGIQRREIHVARSSGVPDCFDTV